MELSRILYLSQADVARINLPMPRIIAAVEAMFHEKAAGRTEMPPKPGIHTQPDSFIHAMPAYIPALRSAGVKWVSGYPANNRSGLPYITGLLILNDVETGIPLAVMDCTWITAKRTGAATAVSAKHLARSDSHTLGVLGCGVQGRSNLEALLCVLPIREVRAYDANAQAAGTFAAEMAKQFPVSVTPVSSPEQAVRECDVVVTAGPILKKPHATIQRGWLPAGAFASLVDYDSYWHPDALEEGDAFCTDDIPQLEHYREMGYFQHIPPIYADLGELVSSKKPGRTTPAQRMIACNLGIALDDMACAPLIYREAMDKKMGTWLPL